MTATTAPQINDASSLRFSHSESKAVGMGGNIVSKFMHEYVPQISGGLTLAANSALLLTANPFAIVAASVGMLGKIIMMTYGVKHTDQKGDGKPHYKAHGYGIGAQIGKITHPRDYPIESAFGMSGLSSALMIGYGLSGGGITPVISESLSLLLSAFVIVGDEKKAEDIDAQKNSLPFAHSKSHALAWLGKEFSVLKNNPVLTSAIVNTAINIGIVVGAVLENNPHLAIAGVLFTASTITQALFLRKNEYNVDGATKADPNDHQPKTFVQRELERRQNGSPQLRAA